MNNSSEILNYIPQREPFVMVSSLFDVTNEKTTSKFLITEGNIFCHNGIFTESGIIENIAQTAAAMVGYNSKDENKIIKKGFIGSINNLKIYNLPTSKQELLTEVMILNKVMNVFIIYGKVKCNDNLIAECEMKIFTEN